MTRPAGGVRWEQRPRLAAQAAVVTGLTVLAVLARRHHLGPPNIHPDDAWVAVGSLKERWFQVPWRALSAPGFSVLLRPVLHLSGGRSVAAAQLPAFVVGCVTPGVLYLVLIDRRIRPAVAGATAFVLVYLPVHVRYSAAVKPYTTDTLLALLLLWLAWRLADDGFRRRGWLALVVLASVAVAISFQTVVPAGIAVAVGGLQGLRTADRRWVLATAAVPLAVVGLVFAVVVRPSLNPFLDSYWTLNFIEAGRGWEVFRFSLDITTKSFVAGFTSSSGLAVRLGLLAIFGLVVWRRRWVGALAAAPILIWMALSVAHRVPFGGGRTDLVLYASVLIAVAVAADVVLERVRPERRFLGSAAVLALAVGLAVATPTPPPSYDSGFAPLVEAVDARRAPGERLLLFPTADYLYAFYTEDQVEVVSAPQNMTGFGVRFTRGDIVSLPDLPRPDDEMSSRVRSAIAGIDRVWVLARLVTGLELVYDDLEGAGLVRVEHQISGSSILELWERRGPDR